MRKLYLDIETSPCVGWFWRTGKTNLGAHQILEPGKIICVSYRFDDWKPGQVETLTWDYNQNDKTLLKMLSKVVKKADLVVAHNGDNFDVKWLNARVAYHKLPEMDIQSTEDTYKMIRRKLYLPSYKLDYLCKYFGLNQKLATTNNLWQEVTFKNNRKALKAMVEYCENDVLVLAELDHRVSDYVDHKLNRSLFVEAGTCPHCASNELVKDGFKYTRVGKYQRYQCKRCHRKSRAGQNLIPSGQYLR